MCKNKTQHVLTCVSNNSSILDGIKVTLKDRQAREIRQAIYEGTNCSLSIGDTADSNDQFILRWTGDTCPSVVESPNPVRIVQDVRPNRSIFFVRE